MNKIKLANPALCHRQPLLLANNANTRRIFRMESREKTVANIRFAELCTANIYLFEDTSHPYTLLCLPQSALQFVKQPVLMAKNRIHSFQNGIYSGFFAVML